MLILSKKRLCCSPDFIHELHENYEQGTALPFHEKQTSYATGTLLVRAFREVRGGKPVDTLSKAVDNHPGCQHHPEGKHLSTIRQTGRQLADNTRLTDFPHTCFSCKMWFSNTLHLGKVCFRQFIREEYYYTIFLKYYIDINPLLYRY